MKLTITIDTDRLTQLGNETLDELLANLPKRIRSEGCTGVIWTRNTANVGRWSSE